MDKVLVYDPTASDKLSSVRGVGRYLQILKENFPEWTYVNDETMKQCNNKGIFINPFFNLLQPPLTLRRLAKKQIAVIHDLIPLKYPSHFPAGIRGNFNIFLNKLALRSYDLIITDSEASKKDIMDLLHIEGNKIKIIYPCLPQSFLKFNENYKLKIENPFCLYVGDATWNKNLVNIARAIKIANVSCVFVGKVFEKSKTVFIKDSLYSNPWQREFKQFIELTKNDKRFIFAGFIPDSELFKLYMQASVNLLLSKDEGFGFSYLEAANFSCPSLLSDIPVLKEISSNQAVFANPLDPHDMADKINKISSDKLLSNKIAASAKTRVEYFSPEKFRSEFLSVL